MSNASFLARCRQMPRLVHRYRNERYDQAKSEVMDWLAATPEGRELLFNRASRRAIVFSRISETWCGADKV